MQHGAQAVSYSSPRSSMDDLEFLRLLRFQDLSGSLLQSLCSDLGIATCRYKPNGHRERNACIDCRFLNADIQKVVREPNKKVDVLQVRTLQLFCREWHLADESGRFGSMCTGVKQELMDRILTGRQAQNGKAVLFREKIEAKITGMFVKHTSRVVVRVAAANGPVLRKEAVVYISGGLQYITTLQHSETLCNTLQHSTAHIVRCNILQ